LTFSDIVSLGFAVTPSTQKERCMEDRSDASRSPDEVGPPRLAVRPTPANSETTPLQRVGVLVEVPRILRQMDVNPEPLLSSVGINPAVLSDIEGRLPFPVVSDLMLKCTEATGRGDFSLTLGASGRLSHLGIIGNLLSSAENFGSALLDFVANHPRYVRGASTYLVDEGDDAILIGHRVYHPGLRGSPRFSEGATAFGRSVFAELCGVEPTRVLISLPRPDDLSPYRRAFGRARLTFEAEHFGLVYSRASLARAIPTADRARHADIRKFIAERWNFLQPDILDRVMRVLVPSVLAGTPSLQATADLLVMHPRTLNRALQTRGLSFRDAVNEARFEMACQLLRGTRVSIGSLAQILGYSEVSAFSRFFTGMSGLPPSDWKEREVAQTSA
jgi:AraC-like DNA-binding protein